MFAQQKWEINGGKREIRKSKQNCNGALTHSFSGNQQKMDVSGPCRPVSGCQIFVHLMGHGRGQRSEGMGPDKKAPKVSCWKLLRISWGRLGSLGVGCRCTCEPKFATTELYTGLAAVCRLARKLIVDLVKIHDKNHKHSIICRAFVAVGDR